ncbi:hypothetical protein SB861_10900 [Paraburkholderia sp. SIMBA_049]
MIEHASEPRGVARAMADIVHGKHRKRIDENTIARGDLPNPADFFAAAARQSSRIFSIFLIAT